MLSNTGWLTRSAMRELEEDVQASDRYVDVGARLTAVRQDPNGAELIPGKPKLRALRTHVFGGIIDTKAERPFRKEASRNPVQWFCSEEQEAIILHRDSDPLGQLVYGSEGAGKTTALVMWLYLRWLEHLGEGREFGITAPTEARCDIVFQEFARMFRPQWYRFKISEGLFTLCDRSRFRLVSTHQQSQAQGSRIQGFNWSAVASDEAQDQVDVHEDIESRGRSAKNGRYKQLRTATAKDDPNWRTLRDQLDAAKDEQGRPLWVRRTLFGRRSPFIPASFWDAKKATMSPREYARRVEAKDVGPERATYPTWSRETNLVTVPDLGWTNVTAHELRGSGPNFSMLVGHDPGELWDVSLFLRAFVESRREHDYYRGIVKPMWVVLGELNTEQSTTEDHIKKLLEHIRGDWQLNLMDRKGRVTQEVNRILVRADPAGNTDNKTDKSVYTQFANAQIVCKPAAYNAENTGHGRVPREAGVELVNTLLCNAANERRLFVARKADGSPAAPKLVAAIESSERDESGKAENARKGKGDVTHWPAALRYALWAVERPRLQLRARES